MTKPANALRSAEWTVEPCPIGDAVAIIQREHYARGAPNTAVYTHGLYRRDDWYPLLGPIEGAALWLPPTRRAAESVADERWRGVLVLSRLVVAPDVPTNGASFLLGRSMAAIDRDRWHTLLTYADTAHGHTGAIYRATNWTPLGEVAAGDTWIGPAGEQRGRKRGGRNRSAADMRAAGYRQVRSRKVKFIHTATRAA